MTDRGLRDFRAKEGWLASPFRLSTVWSCAASESIGSLYLGGAEPECQGRLRLRDLDFWRGAINLRAARAMLPAEHPGNALRRGSWIRKTPAPIYRKTPAAEARLAVAGNE
jgi:hypothetical protein